MSGCSGGRSASRGEGVGRVIETSRRVMAGMTNSWVHGDTVPVAVDSQGRRRPTRTPAVFRTCDDVSVVSESLFSCPGEAGQQEVKHVRTGTFTRH
jgi:hypothetical protein